MRLAELTRDDARNRRSLMDRWCRALDQRRIDDGTRSWVAQVMGVHVDGRNLWIQITPADTPDQSLVLHLSRWTTIDQAIAAVKAGFLKHDSYPRVISATLAL